MLSPRVGIVSWLQEGCQNRLAGSVSIEELVRNPQWTHYLLTGSEPSCSHGTIPRRGDKATQSSAPEEGHMVARNMLSNL